MKILLCFLGLGIFLFFMNEYYNYSLEYYLTQRKIREKIIYGSPTFDSGRRENPEKSGGKNQ